MRFDFDKLTTEQQADGLKVGVPNNEKFLQDSLMEEVKKCKEELEVSQKYLELANNKNMQLQVFFIILILNE